MKILLSSFTLIVAVHFCGAFPEEENIDPDGRLFGGDMMLTAEQRLQVEMEGDLSRVGDKATSRSAMSNVSLLWLPNNKIVPWTVTPDLESQAEATFGMMAAFREWEERSCITFKRRTHEVDYIQFINESGCWSYVGRQGGAQNISLDDGCRGTGTVVHEIGHAMGFGHEQNRPDRDQYIKVRWENIPEKKRHNFNKYTDLKVNSLNSPYDYKSFMQYSKTAFGINDSITLDPIKANVHQLGQRVGFTLHDQFQAMKLYKCQGRTTRPTTIQRRYKLEGDFTCDFEAGLCGFMQDSNNDIDWLQRYGGTPSSKTGPEVDHTTGRMGTFLYMEASAPSKENDTARVKSKTFVNITGPQCFSFFYHMFANNASMMGKFNVYLDDELNVQKKVFSQSRSESKNDWIKVMVLIKPLGPYYITFEAIRGSGYQGDIAIDDISISKGSCKVDVQIIQKETNCSDIHDREAQYCLQWKNAGYCSSKEKDMKRFCKQTCNFCS